MNEMKTITYSRVGDLEIQLDLYLPPNVPQGPKGAIIFFHGGGMVAGGRKTLFYQHWLLNSTLDNNLIFISADHRLLLPSTGFDIIEDVNSLFTFLTSSEFSTENLPSGVTLDPTRLAVVGESGGGYPARAAGIYASPKPKAIMLQYGMGGEILNDYWLSIKDPSTLPPEFDHITRENFASQFAHHQPPISYDPLLMMGDEPLHPGQAQSNRVMGVGYWIKFGEILDGLLGEKISNSLRGLPYEDRFNAIPEKLRPAILQCQLKADFPPTVLVHGKSDALILTDESELTTQTLKQLGVKVELLLVEGAGHSLKDAAEQYAMPQKGERPKLMAGAQEALDKAFAFVLRELQG